MTGKLDPSSYTGFATLSGGVLEARLTDVWGFITSIHGTPETRAGVRGWALTATVIVPEGLKIPWETDEAPP